MPHARTAYAGFAVFGAFWGVWGASVPAIRDQAGLTDGALGAALLFVGAGALPAMLTVGRAVDRWGHRVTAALLVLLGVVGVGLALSAHGLVSLAIGLAVLGAASGAADVGLNAAAGTAERAAGRPVITRAHAAFSAAVVGGSLATGLLGMTGAPVVTPFLLVALGAVGAGLMIARLSRPKAPGDPIAGAGSPGAGLGRAILPLLLVVGGLGALAFAVENAHQSWSALYLSDVLSVGALGASAGPALFAAVVALSRFAAGALPYGAATAVLIGGAMLAAAGTTVLALASGVAMALLGLAVAAAGTSVLFPTLLSFATGRVAEPVRGAATSVVSTVAYLGFLAGPVYVGLWAQAVDLPGAMLAVAALAAVLAVLAWPAMRLFRGVERLEGQRTRSGS